VLRKLYIKLMQLRGEHVLAADCWCKPERTDYRGG